MLHTAAGFAPIPCMPGCSICPKIDRGGPHYSEPHRRLFHPAEFPPVDRPEPPRAAPAPAPTAARSTLPLAGDLVAAVTARIGADRFARYVADRLGVDCGCAARQIALNKLDVRLRKWLGWQ